MNGLLSVHVCFINKLSSFPCFLEIPLDADTVCPSCHKFLSK